MNYASYVHDVLIVSGSEKGRIYFKNILLDSNFTFNIHVLSDSYEARRQLLNNKFEIIIVNSPLLDESGLNFAIHAKTNSNSIVIYVVKAEAFDDVINKALENNILIIGKPLNKALFYQTLNNVLILEQRKREYENEIDKLKNKLEETRLVSKAKCLLVEHKHITEEDAHKYIEKKAMDSRDKKINIAIEIIRSYTY